MDDFAGESKAAVIVGGKQKDAKYSEGFHADGIVHQRDGGQSAKDGTCPKRYPRNYVR